MRLASTVAQICLLFFWSPVAWAQFQIDGVVHDSETLAPLSDVVLFVLDDNSGELIPPGSLTSPDQQGQITGADGRYEVGLADRSRTIRLSFERADARFVFPSRRFPPLGDSEGGFGGFGCGAGRCSNGTIDPSRTPAGGIYALRFQGSATGGARNNHVPIDRLDRLVQIKLTQDKERAHRGGYITYAFELKSDAPQAINDLNLRVTLPRQLRFLPRSLHGERLNNGAQTSFTPEPSQTDLSLVFGVSLAPGEQATVRFSTRAVGPIRGRTRIQTTASAVRAGGIVLAEARSTLWLEGDPTLDTSTIMGRVFCDQEDGTKAWQDDGESGLYGARVYLDTGFWVEADTDGLFSFTGVPREPGF